ncbi:MAG: hypothetical protein COX48_05990 [bacterium (Candidatus Stahlbacteria) CG23_combo_of_CG06-09_8_20_14_all_34_7]|nr:MAG: hypothetical protein COX48_05990 [bacterium (Candidatus Stahlbacteria) CG23_combo_of_CG06-09_8_20_14_all_34_7]
MNKKELLKEMEEAFSGMGISVKYEAISGDGGYCKYREKEFVILNRILPLSSRINSLKSILKEILSKKEDIFIKPVLREYLDGEKND